jgi:multimeric flavodoxin WrbA
MRITILNGNPAGGNSTFNAYQAELGALLLAQGHTLTRFDLQEMDIRYCTGCLKCWLANPGQCATRDDSHAICAAYINSDLVIFASPILMGYTSALLKRAHDKLIPLVHPYFVFINGETHHRPRYKTYPRMGLLLEQGADGDEKDVGIISNIYRRDAINLLTSLVSTWMSTHPLAEIANEIDRL